MKIGIVGCGLISGHHLTAAARFPGARIIGLVDRDTDRARSQAQRFSVPHTFANLSDLLALQPDVVHVLTPPESHEAVVLEALAAGAHVYVEKPMAVSVAACERMVHAAEQASRLLCVGHCLLFSPAMVRARELLASGAVGEIVQVAASFNYDVRRNPNFGKGHWSNSLPGGLAEDLAVHPASLLISLLGEPRKISSARRGAEVAALIETDRGLGTLSLSLRARPDMSLVDIYGTRRMLRLNISSMAVTVHRDFPVPKVVGRAIGNVDVAKQLLGGTAGSAWKLLRGKVDGSYGIIPLVHAFYRAVQSGAPAPVDAGEGVTAVGILRSIWPQDGAAGGLLDIPATLEDSRPPIPAPAGARRHVLVTGATGYIGAHLVRALLRQGDSVRILARNPSRTRLLQEAGAEVVVGDLGDEAGVAGIADGMDVVFHLGSAISGSDALFERVDVQGTERLLTEAERAGVRRFVFAGTLSSYKLASQRDGAVLNEKCPIDQTGQLGGYARAKARAEEAIQAAQRRGRMECVVLRIGLVCGMGAPTLPAHVCRAMGSHLLVFGDGRIPLPLTLIDNAVDALMQAGVVQGIGGEVFNIVDDDVLTQSQYLALYGEAIGEPLQILRLPRLAYYTLGALTEVMAALHKKEPATTRYRVRTRLRSVRWDCSKAHRMLQWQPRVPLRSGLTRSFRAAQEAVAQLTMPATAAAARAE
jgi:predicted dehydrogenase/uncharacterized protein YbjT (DUF2867 family)